jgi:hypothetical protein
MANYFSYLPEFDYVSRLPNAKIGDYARVKNLFKKGKIRDDIFKNLAFFERYKIKGDDRPDNVAHEIYADASLDWVILLSNNIINIQTEWPLPQTDFDRFVLDKYGDYDTLYNGVHHYETQEVKNSQGVTIVPAGLEVPEKIVQEIITESGIRIELVPYFVSYYDFFTDQQITTGNISIPVTNYEYEEKIENNKRNIFVLKQNYLGIILNDMEEIMTYKEGSSQYVREDLKKGDNIRLYS